MSPHGLNCGGIGFGPSANGTHRGANTATVSIVIAPANDAPVLDWYDADWEERKALTVLAADVPADVTDFPLWVSQSARSVPCGCGSDKDVKVRIRETAAEDVDFETKIELLLEHYSADQPVRLVGHSMGANVAGLYAGIRPERVRAFVNV